MIDRKKDITLGCVDFYTPDLSYNMLRSFWSHHKDSVEHMPLILLDNTAGHIIQGGEWLKEKDAANRTRLFFANHGIPSLARGEHVCMYRGGRIDVDGIGIVNRTDHGAGIRELIHRCQTKYLIIADSDIIFRRNIFELLDKFDDDNVVYVGRYKAMNSVFCIVDIEKYREHNFYYNGLHCANTPFLDVNCGTVEAFNKGINYLNPDDQPRTVKMHHVPFEDRRNPLIINFPAYGYDEGSQFCEEVLFKGMSLFSLDYKKDRAVIEYDKVRHSKGRPGIAVVTGRYRGFEYYIFHYGAMSRKRIKYEDWASHKNPRKNIPKFINKFDIPLNFFTKGFNNERRVKTFRIEDPYAGDHEEWNIPYSDAAQTFF